MVDLSLETIRAVVLLGIVIFLLNAGRACFGMNRKGWNLIIGGFGLLFFGSLLDITDNFEGLNRFIVIGNTEVEAFLEKFVGFLGGFCLLALGLIRWIPCIQRLPAEILQRKQAEEALRQARDTLEQRVRERTAQLESQGEDLARLAADLKTARDEAYLASRAKSKFLMGMSHELRTPLNAIIGFAETMSNETLGPVGSTKYREYCMDIHSSGQHLLNLINDILDLSKVEAGAEELLEEDIEVPEAIRSVLRLVQEHATKASVELELDVPDDLPLLRADKRKVMQILINLLTNGIKFTNAGGKVRFRTWCRADSGFVFQIVDTGIGIGPEDIPKAFSQFGQVNNVISRRYEGTGLGLPLTKALVELHGGSIDLQSQVGVGTTVTVNFPAARIGRSPQDTSSPNMDDREESGGFHG